MCKLHSRQERQRMPISKKHELTADRLFILSAKVSSEWIEHAEALYTQAYEQMVPKKNMMLHHSAFSHRMLTIFF